MNTICRQAAQIALVCAVLSLLGLQAQAQTYVFGNASYSAPGLNFTSPPQGTAAITTADFNGDGILDGAVLGTISSGQVLSIFLGRRIFRSRSGLFSSGDRIHCWGFQRGRQTLGAFFWGMGTEPSDFLSH
jgi:hypothetical protein